MRVFLGHTSEFVHYPATRSFLAAAQAALIRASCTVVEMNYFPASGRSPEELCRDRVLSCETFVGIVGFRYGSIIPGKTISYTEFEYDVATDAGMPRHVFFLAEDAEVPFARFFSYDDYEAQVRFRRRIRESSITFTEFRTPDELETRLYQALREFQTIRPPAGGGTEIRTEAAVDKPHTALFQLPPDIRDFTNREDILRSILGQVTYSSGEPRTFVVSSLTGKPGIGKTALAIRIAHEIRHAFPDGQLYVNLRGYEPQRLDPFDVLGEFIRALGVAGPAIPLTLDGRIGLYRSTLADRRALVVLDNAADEAQVRPLLPGSPGCAVLVTSRSRLSALDSARSVTVEVLEPDVALQLFESIVGKDRVDREPAAAQEIVALCGRLPLAIRIAGSRLIARRHWKLSQLAERLRDQETILSELRVGDREVLANFAISYSGLGERQRRLFRLLGLLRFGDFPAWVASALLGPDVATADDLLEDLVEAHLIDWAGEDALGRNRYRFHDLIRSFARSRLREEEPRQRQVEALDRLGAAYLAFAERADARLHHLDGAREIGVGTAARDQLPAPTVLNDIDEKPALWLIIERANIMRLAEQLLESERWPATWELVGTLEALFDREAMWSYWREAFEVGKEAATRSGDQNGLGYMLYGLGIVGWFESRWVDAVDLLTRASTVFEEIGDRRGWALTMRRLGVVHRDSSRWVEASECYQAALTYFQSAADSRHSALVLRNLGDVYRDQGEFTEARQRLEESLRRYEELEDDRGIAYALRSLGDALWGQGDLIAAASCFDRCVPLFRRLDDRRSLGRALRNQGMILRDQGRHEDAAVVYGESLEIFRDLGDRHGEARTLHCLGIVDADRGNHSVALGRYEASLAVFRELGDRLWEAKTDHLLGRSLVAFGQTDGGSALMDEAVDIFRQLGMLESTEVRKWLGVT